MKYDLLLDDDMELREDAATLDLVEGECTAQHQQLLLITPKGAWKENPDTGVGLVGFLESESETEMFAEINRQFRADGMQVKEIKIESGKLLIDASYS
jgi:hypothetical protein